VARILTVIVAFVAISAAGAEPAGRPIPPADRPHPAVVRIVAMDDDGFSSGSGSLVAVNDLFGMIVTNWHVVRDAVGPIAVHFPDGFRSMAVVLQTDRDWDLAALAISRPHVRPIAISNRAPQPGEMLTIAGYDKSRTFRMVSGRCIKYASPMGNFPAEMIKLEVSARQGDSGGPILDDRGNLVGVLWGSASGETFGSYCGRLRSFLNSADVDFVRLSERTLAARQASSPSTVPMTPIPPAVAADRASPPPALQKTPPIVTEKTPPPIVARNAPPRPTGKIDDGAPLLGTSRVEQNPSADTACKQAVAHKREDTVPVAAVPAPSAAAPLSAAEQIKTILAAVGVLAMLYHAARLLGRAVG
jgi:hypothetical protein